MTGTTDVVDAVVVTVALRNDAVILTGDPDDIARLVRATGREAGVVAV
jgi:predicted nuclease of predicted toxin-antitoxin system